MPLIHGKSKKAFEHNVEAEMDAGKPQKQSLAIAYALKRKAARKMAEGGMLTKDGYQSECDENCVDESHEHMNEKASGFVDHKGNDVKHNSMAMSEDDRDLNQHGEIEEGPQGGYADGGFIEDNYQNDAHEMDMVGRIMKQRQECFSKGGMVANDTPITAGFKENDFDDLALRDDLESSYTGANSGDEKGNAREDKDRADMVSRIMASRKKKDRMPHPA